MPLRREHRKMTSAEQQAAGAAARERIAGRPLQRAAASAEPAATPARRQPSRGELTDAERYRRMRQDQRQASPLGRARAAGAELADRVNGKSGVSDELRQSGEYRRNHGSLLSEASDAIEDAKAGISSRRKAGARQVAGARRAGRRAVTPKRVVACLLAAILAFSVLITVRLGSGISLETRAALSPVLPGQPFYMLLVGTDKSEERVEDGSTGGTFRTDSIILARVDPIAAKLTLVSIQRDTLVDLGGDYGKQKINAAYTYGGAPLLIDAVSELAGVKISHYAEIDFDSFTSVVDTLGGIDVNVPIDIDDDLADVHLSAGEQTIDGAEALGLCRARHAYDQYGSGDYYRTSNQRMVLGAILKKALSGNPLLLFAVLNTASESVSTDLTGIELMLLGARFVGFDMSTNLYSGLEPTSGVYEGGVWYEKVNEEAWKTMMSRVDQGLAPYADESEDPTAGLAGITQ